MNPITWGMIAAGLVLLTWGAEWLVKGASRLALRFGVSPLAVGLTVVAYGTSTPELFVSVQAGLAGAPDIAVANVVGSNIFNVLLILGLCAVILPIRVAQQLVRLDIPIMIGVSIISGVLAIDGRLGRIDGTLLLAGIVSYTVWAIRKSRAETAAVKQEYTDEFGQAPDTLRSGRALAVSLLYLVAGLALLALGSRWLIGGATELARHLGVSDAVIGLTIVAAGTSLPELATSVMAALRGERDIAIGNIVGSNLYNLLGILGLSALLTPGGLVVSPGMLSLDIPVMIGAALVCAPIVFTGGVVSRTEGAVLLLGYVFYTTLLVLNAGHSPHAATFGHLLLVIYVPAVAIGLSAHSALTWSRARG